MDQSYLHLVPRQWRLKNEDGADGAVRMVRMVCSACTVWLAV
jgi:hypothetical protein